MQCTQSGAYTGWSVHRVKCTQGGLYTGWSVQRVGGLYTGWSIPRVECTQGELGHTYEGDIYSDGHIYGVTYI